jgi:hypothetical protein
MFLKVYVVTWGQHKWKPFPSMVRGVILWYFQQIKVLVDPWWFSFYICRWAWKDIVDSKCCFSWVIGLCYLVLSCYYWQYINLRYLKGLKQAFHNHDWNHLIVINVTIKSSITCTLMENVQCNSHLDCSFLQIEGLIKVNYYEPYYHNFWQWN